MTGNDNLLAQPIFQAIGWALLHFIWQGALIALLYASLRVILRDKAANVRYAIACGAMLLMLMLPVITTLFIKRAAQQLPAVTQGQQPTAAIQTTTTWMPDATAGEMANSQARDQATWTASPEAGETTIDQGLALKKRLASLLPWLVSIWLVGVLLLSLRVLGGWAMAQRLKSWRTAPAAEKWQKTAEHLAYKLRVSRPVRLCESLVAEVPTVIGWLRPVILLPASALLGLSPQQIEALLAHELAHIRRHDYLINLLQTAVETLLFYHPAVWWVSRQVRTEREHCCDDLAVAACGNVLAYARALAELEQLRGTTPMPQLAVAANGGGTSLLVRIQRLIDAPASPHQRSSGWLASFVAIATILSIYVGARTTLFNAEAAEQGTHQSRARASGLAEPGDAADGLKSQTSIAEARAEFQIDLPRIRESVTVIGFQTEEGLHPATDIMPAIADHFTAVASTPIAPVVVGGPALKGQDGDDDGASTSYIDALAAVGYTKLTVDELVRMRNHGISPRYIKELKALGYQLPSVEMAIRLTDHGVSIGFIKGLADVGYKNVYFEDLIRARDHGVQVEVIKALNAAGYSNLSLDQIIRAIDHGVGPSYIKAMADVGFQGLSLDQLIRMRDHGVGADYIKEIRSLGYNNVTADQFVRLRDHGVSASFLRKAKERGFNNLSLEELIKLADADIL